MQKHISGHNLFLFFWPWKLKKYRKTPINHFCYNPLNFVSFLNFSRSLNRENETKMSEDSNTFKKPLLEAFTLGGVVPLFLLQDEKCCRSKNLDCSKLLKFVFFLQKSKVLTCPDTTKIENPSKRQIFDLERQYRFKRRETSRISRQKRLNKIKQSFCDAVIWLDYCSPKVRTKARFTTLK